MPKVITVTFIALPASATHRRTYLLLAKTLKEYSQKPLNIQIWGTGKEPVPAESIEFHLERPVKRLSRGRLFLQFKVFKYLLFSSDNVYVVSAPEFLPMLMLFKFVRRYKLIYDVQENYVNNIRYGSGYSNFLRNFLARMVRLTERTAVRFFLDGVVYAEEGFDNMLKVREERKVIFRNLYPDSEKNIKTKTDLPPYDFPYLLVSGTWAEEWGVFKSLEVFEYLQLINPSNEIRLVIAGYGADKETVKQLYLKAEKISQVYLEGGSSPLPFERIELLIRHCVAGLALYRPGIRMADRIPTKFYEYLYHQKTLFFSDFEPWNAFNLKHPFGVPVPFESAKETAEIIYQHPETNTEIRYSDSSENFSLKKESEGLISLVAKRT